MCIKGFHRKLRSRPSFPFALYCMTNFQRLDWQALFQLENESALWSHLSSSKKKKERGEKKSVNHKQDKEKEDREGKTRQTAWFVRRLCQSNWNNQGFFFCSFVYILLSEMSLNTWFCWCFVWVEWWTETSTSMALLPQPSLRLHGGVRSRVNVQTRIYLQKCNRHWKIAIYFCFFFWAKRKRISNKSVLCLCSTGFPIKSFIWSGVQLQMGGNKSRQANNKIVTEFVCLTVRR